MQCVRCRKEAAVTIMSVFNKDAICLECKEKEKRHPDYRAAKEAEEEQVRRGNLNFEGVGKPADL